MQNILILDIEATGLDHQKDTVVEVAAALWSVPHRALLDVRSMLVRTEQLNAAFHVNRIPDALIAQGNVGWSEAESLIGDMMYDADATVAHNADYDRAWFSKDVAERTPWICSCDDLDWPRTTQSKGLVSLALDHGVGVVSAHRALADVLTLARLFEAVAPILELQGRTLEEFLARGLRPKARFQALVPIERKDEAKSAGFHWNPGPVGKGWFRNMAIEDAALLRFPTRQVAK